MRAGIGARGRWSVGLLVLAILFVSSRPASADAESLERVSSLGPVQVRLVVAPSEPIIGDVIHLDLVVEAESGVEVLMPEFGEALGRFEIVDFAPSAEQLASGSTVARQTYRLQPAHSGPQTIPPLRVEFVDRRPGQTAAPPGEDAYEILTERVSLEVQPILAEDAPLKLKPAHPDLGPRRTNSRALWVWGLAALVLAAALGPFVWRYVVAARDQRRRQSAYEVARGQLDALLAGGLPDSERMDAFYVGLSLIVRTYLENRFGLRSPELTTQEFLTEMGRSPDLARSHQRLLQNFLEEADLVKFAGHRPSAEVVGASIAAAEQFLTETRDFVRVGDASLPGSEEPSRA